MAVFVRTNLVNNYLDRVKSGDAKRLKDALNGDAGDDSRKSVSQILGAADFVITGTTDSNDAALNTGAANSIALNLSTEGGVSFPSGFSRDIRIVSVSSYTGPVRTFQSFTQRVIGGTDPTLDANLGQLNNQPLASAFLTFSSGTPTNTASNMTGGLSFTSAQDSTGLYSFAFPKARRANFTTGFDYNGQTIATAATHMEPTSINLAAGTGKLRTIGAATPALVNPVSSFGWLMGDILPVEDPSLAIVTTTTPDQVIVGAVGISATAITWNIFVQVGQAVPLAF